MRKLFGLLCFAILLCAIPAHCDAIDDEGQPVGHRYPDSGALLKKLQFGEFQEWKEALNELTQRLEKKERAAAFYITNDTLAAALRHVPIQGNALDVSYPQSQFIKALLQYSPNLPLPFIDQLIDLSEQKYQFYSLSDSTISALAIRSDEAAIHFLLDRAVSDAQNKKAQSIATRVLVNRNWNLVPQIFSYFQTKREPFAAKAIAPILNSIVGLEMADVILKSRIETSKSAQERDGLTQLRTSLKKELP